MPAPTHASPEVEATPKPAPAQAQPAPVVAATSPALGSQPLRRETDDDTDWDAIVTRPARPRSHAVTERPAALGPAAAEPAAVAGPAKAPPKPLPKRPGTSAPGAAAAAAPAAASPAAEEQQDQAERAAEREVRKAAATVEKSAKLTKQVEKQTVKVAKGMEKAEDTANKQARVVGTGVRTKGIESVGQDLLGSGGVNVSDSPSYVYLTARVDAVMHRFHQRHRELCVLWGVAYEDSEIDALPKEERLEERQHRRRYRYQAYDEVWGTLDDPVVMHYRPQLGTSSERLVSEVLEERGAASKGGKSVEAADRALAFTQGTLLDEDVEERFDAWAVRVTELEKDEATREGAIGAAHAEIFGAASVEIAKKVPKDEQMLRAARRQARERLGARQRVSPDDGPVRTQEQTTAETVESTASTAASVSKAGTYATKAASWVSGKAGKAETSALQAEAVKNGAQAPGASSYSAAGSIPGVSMVSKPIEDAVANKKNGVQDPQKLAEALPKSVATQAAEGIGTVSSFLNDLITGFDAAIKMIRGIGEAHEAGTTEKRLVATKATSDGLAGMVKITASTSKLAVLMDPGVAGAVAQFVPGLQIAVSATSLMSSITETVRVGRHMRHADAALLKARFSSVASGAVDVMVRPMLLTSSLLTQNFENCVWQTYQAISSLTTGILTVAGGGLFGIPAAIDAGNKVLNLLHKGGHAIANQVRAYQSMEANEAGVAAAEGSAEQRLSKTPGMAIDGILHHALTKKDPAALAFLEGYDITPAVLAKTPMGTLRDTLLKDLGTDADPTTLYAKFKAGYGRFSAWVDEESGPSRWDQVSQMTEDRNRVGAADGGKADRGTLFKIKKYLDVAGLDKSLARTKETRIVCQVGKLTLRGKPEIDQIDAFIASIASDAVTEAEIEAALKDPRTEKVFHETLRRELVKRAAPRYKNKPLPPPPTRPRSTGGPPPKPLPATPSAAAAPAASGAA